MQAVHSHGGQHARHRHRTRHSHCQRSGLIENNSEIFRENNSIRQLNISFIAAPMPVTSAITAASLLAVSLILMVCACLLCRSKRKLCFRASAEKDVNNAHAQNSYSNKAESKVSLVNETKDKNGSQLKITPH